MTDLYVEIPERGDPRLGRVIVHDPRSRNFPLAATIDRSTWRDKAVRIYDPLPNPNQPRGNCTGCAVAMDFNAIGNRKTGQVLDMSVADTFYSLATSLDPFDGQWPPEDTGSSTLAAAKAAVQLGYGGEYRWLFSGADEVVQTIMDGRVVRVGTYWYWDMFKRDASGRVRISGGVAGGHAWVARGYDIERDWVLGRCWWGDFKDFWLTRADLDTLLRQRGEALVQRRVA